MKFVNSKRKKNNSDYIKADRKGKARILTEKFMVTDSPNLCIKCIKLSKKNYSRKGKNKFSQRTFLKKIMINRMVDYLSTIFYFKLLTFLYKNSILLCIIYNMIEKLKVNGDKIIT